MELEGFEIQSKCKHTEFLLIESSYAISILDIDALIYIILILIDVSIIS